PKFGLLAPATQGGTIAARYFMPWKTHHAMAVTGAQCLAACAMAPGSVAQGMAALPQQTPTNIELEHPTGKIDVLIDCACEGEFDVHSVGLVRTARKIADGNLYIPAALWRGN
ncbi:MAG: PrpF domain-containing protein, partial [Pseudomonadota bacterium]